MGENNLYIHNVDLVDPVDLDPQFYFASFSDALMMIYYEEKNNPKINLNIIMRNFLLKQILLLK